MQRWMGDEGKEGTTRSSLCRADTKEKKRGEKGGCGMSLMQRGLLEEGKRQAGKTSVAVVS